MLQPDFHFAERYNLLTLLGRGGFSEVWLAEDLMAKVQVALKVYAPGQGVDDAGIEMFRKEFALVADMNHTNLLRPTFYGYWNRMPFLVLPFCEEGSLQKYVDCGQRISEEEAWKVLRDVSAGLAYLHNHQPPIVHQDIKPGNILVGTNGKSRCYMITDFGISAKMRNTIGADRKSFSSGTIAYMGPERFGDDAASVMASDIWSLGATMCELMTGNVPYGESGGQAQKGGATMMDMPQNYSKSLCSVIRKCLDLQPWDRPDAQAIFEMADGHISGRKKVGKLVRFILILLAIAAVAIAGLLVRNKMKSDQEALNIAIETAKNDSLSNERIDKALDLIYTGDTLLLRSLDSKKFEEMYMEAHKVLNSIDTDFGAKISESVRIRRASVDSTAKSHLLSAADTLQRKSAEVKALNNKFFVEFVERLDARAAEIEQFVGSMGKDGITE